MESRINVSKEKLSDVATMMVESLPVCNGATVLLLTGDLGTGKTTFVQNIAATLGIGEVVNSPTFVLQKIYHTSHHRFATLVHLDLYRLHSSDEVEVLQLEQWTQDPQVLLCIEWPDRIKQWSGEVCVYPVSFTEVSETERVINMKGITLPTNL